MHFIVREEPIMLLVEARHTWVMLVHLKVFASVIKINESGLRLGLCDQFMQLRKTDLLEGIDFIVVAAAIDLSRWAQVSNDGGHDGSLKQG